MANKNFDKIREVFSPEGGFYHWTGKIFDIIALSFFWLVGCIPIVTIGASCTALYYASSKSIRQDIGTISKSFWKSYKANLKASIPLWLIAILFGFLFTLNIGIVMRLFDGGFGAILLGLYVLLFAVLVSALCYAFPALSRFDMSVGWIIKLSLYSVFKHLPITLLLLALLVGCYFAIYWQIWLVLILPGLFGVISSIFVDKILDKHMPKEGEELV